MTPFDPRGPYDVVWEDVPYGGPPDAPLLARIYRPVRASGSCAVLVDVHGGAWSHFDRTVDAYYDRALAACGTIVVALDFRQAPARHPAAVCDVLAGVRFVKANASRLGFVRSPVGIVGGSSGGHLALLAAVRPNAPEWATTPYVGQRADVAVDASVAYVLALWPIADPLARYRYLLDRLEHPRPPRDRFFAPERLRGGHEAYFGDEATMAAASVPRLVAAGEAERLPPIWVAHPELDENVTLEMSEALVSAYRGAGGPVTLAMFPAVGHAFANVPGPEADGCIEQMKAFVASQLMQCG